MRYNSVGATLHSSLPNAKLNTTLGNGRCVLLKITRIGTIRDHQHITPSNERCSAGWGLMWANAHAEQLRWSSRSCCWHPRHAAGRRLKNRMVTAASKDEKAADHATGVDKIAQESVAGPYDVLRSATSRRPAGAAVSPPLKGDMHILYAIPPATLNTPLDQVLECPNMRDFLGLARPNPLLKNLAGVYEGRFVSDEDRVAINVMQFSCSSSIGAHRAGFPNTPGTPTSSSSSSTTVSQGLALSSEMYGSMENAESVFDGGSLDLLQGNGQQQESGGSGPNQQHYDTCMPLPPYAMRAGPREDIFFDPSTVTAAIMTTGNICPGMNDTIEAMVKRLQDYGVPEDNVMGIRYGVRGFWARDAKPVVLTSDKIDGIHLTGGTILGTSDDHRLKRHHHHHHHHNHETASEVSEGPSPLSSTSTLDTDEESSSSGSSSPTATASGSSSATSSSSNGRRRQGRAPLFVTYEDRLEAILDKLEFWRINILLVIGGQGGNQLGAQLAEGCQRRGIPCCIAGVPKSIDNDVMLVDKTFGFDTVVQEVVTRPLLAAKVEAASARKGVGLVKVFGRRAGFIALQSSLASGAVDICLIPEEPFELDGPSGMLAYLQQLLDERGHAVICVSEGAGQNLLYPGGVEAIPVDEAGNPKLRDIGTFLKSAIKKAIPDVDVKYIDPSNMVQAVPCNAADHIFCRVLGFHAVDVAFAGYTGVLVGPVNGHFCMLPSQIITQSARRVDPRGKNWNRLRAAIGQPRFINGVPSDQAQPRPPSAAAAAGAGRAAAPVG